MCPPNKSCYDAEGWLQSLDAVVRYVPCLRVKEFELIATEVQDSLSECFSEIKMILCGEDQLGICVPRIIEQLLKRIGKLECHDGITH